MNMFKNRSGQMRVLEVILASFVLLGALAFVNVFVTTPRSATYEVDDLQKLGYNVLHNLDEQRLLTRFVYDQSEWAANFTNALRVSLPTGVFFDLTVRDPNGTILNPNVPIRYGDLGVFTNSNATSSVTYMVTGYTSASQATYDPRVLLLLLVRE